MVVSDRKKKNGRLRPLYQLMTVCACLILSLTLPAIVSASGPEDGPPVTPGRRVGLVSTSAACVTVEPGIPARTSTTVLLEWEGQIEKAFLVLAAAGSEGGHSIYVNGQLIGGAPVQPGGQPCQADFVEEIPIPADVLVKGENVIVLTNDANINDDWTAADLHLEIHGALSGPPLAVLENPWLALSSPPEIGAMAVVTGMVVLPSSYDPISHTVWYQGLDSSCPGGSPAPLLLGIHGYNGSGQGWVEGITSAEGRERCWLLAGPDMHGSYYTSHGKYSFAWPGAQHDIIDALEYMIANYNVDTSRIYIAGGSMGGQTAAVMAAKYPDLFAAAAPWKPITDLADWYYDGWPTLLTRLRRETGNPGCNPVDDPDFDAGCGTPPDVPFEYQRRSGIEMPQNSRLVLLKIWHDVQDEVVVITHSLRLEEAINGWNPITPVALSKVDTGDEPNNLCDLTGRSGRHCYNPPPLTNSFSTTITLTVDSLPVGNLFDFLEGFTRGSQPPLSVTIRTDESKPYYWLKVVQTGGDHWSEVEASYDLANKSVTATISDTRPLTVAFNLGSTPIPGTANIPQPGLDLPENTTYLVREEGDNIFSYEEDYTSGYFTVTLNNTGRFSLTISAIVDLSPPQRTYLPVVIKSN